MALPFEGPVTTEEPSPDTTDPNATPARHSHVHVLTAALIGDPVVTDLDHRVLNGLMFLAVLTGVVSTLQNAIIGASRVMFVSTLLCTVGGVVGYLTARKTRRPYPLKLALYVFFLALLIFSWLTQSGSQGTIGYYFILVACYAVLLFPGVTKIVTLALTALTLGALLTFEHYRPDLIGMHASSFDRFVDVALAVPLCLTMVVGVLHLVYREYQRERRAKDRVLEMVTAERNRVERAMREKQRLLSVVSHDIANALTVLQAEIEMANLPGRERVVPAPPDLEQMAYACTKIEEIIGSVRMMESLEQQSRVLTTKPVDLMAMFEYAEVIFGKRLARRRMRFVFPTLDDRSRFVMAEPRILANQVFGNLISNAIKYSYLDSRIVFSVTRRGNTTTVQVSDEGIGMPPDMLSALFAGQANTPRKGTQGEQGTGFGLRAVKHFVELFGGWMEIASRAEAEHPDDHGTTVSVHLQCAANPEPA